MLLRIGANRVVVTHPENLLSIVGEQGREKRAHVDNPQKLLYFTRFTASEAVFLENLGESLMLWFVVWAEECRNPFIDTYRAQKARQRVRRC